MQNERIKNLLNETNDGIIKRDKLETNGYFINHPEAEIYYFQELKKFFETILGNRIINYKQEPDDFEKFKKNTKI